MHDKNLSIIYSLVLQTCSTNTGLQKVYVKLVIMFSRMKYKDYFFSKVFHVVLLTVIFYKYLN